MQCKAHDAGGSHLDRRDTHFSITLREVPITSREQCPIDTDWQKQFGTARELLDVEVAAVLPSRVRAQPIGRGGAHGGHSTVWIGRQDKPAAARSLGLASGPCSDLVQRRGYA